jgi:hypothetical protein
MYVSQLRFIVYRILKMQKKKISKKNYAFVLILSTVFLCVLPVFLFFFLFGSYSLLAPVLIFLFHFKFIILFANPYLNIFVNQAYLFAFGLVKNNSCLGKEFIVIMYVYVYFTRREIV